MWERKRVAKNIFQVEIVGKIGMLKTYHAQSIINSQLSANEKKTRDQKIIILFDGLYQTDRSNNRPQHTQKLYLFTVSDPPVFTFLNMHISTQCTTSNLNIKHLTQKWKKKNVFEKKFKVKWWLNVTGS